MWWGYGSRSVSGGFVLQGLRGCRLQYVEAAASDVVWWPWSVGSCPGQFGLHVTRSCGFVVRARAVAFGAAAPEGGPGSLRTV